MFIFVWMSKKFLFLLVVILEGGALLSYEIMAAKLYTPHVGATLYVWTSILTLTLISLAIAYRVSQYWSDKKNWKVLPISLLMAGLYLFIVLLTKETVLPLTYTMGIKTASIFTGIFILTIPVFCMGLTSPLVTALLTSTDNKEVNAGKNAGLVYGLGTLSGILFTLISLFVLLPAWGVSVSITFLASILLLAAGISFWLLKSSHD
jgi:predicted membrane-bound spermidine synthase